MAIKIGWASYLTGQMWRFRAHTDPWGFRNGKLKRLLSALCNRIDLFETALTPAVCAKRVPVADETMTSMPFPIRHWAFRILQFKRINWTVVHNGPTVL